MAEEPKPPESPESPKQRCCWRYTSATRRARERGSCPSPAAKPTAPARPAPPPPKPPVLMQIPLDNDLTKRYREHFGTAILDAVEDRKQPYLVIDATHLAGDCALFEGHREV